jgi:large subunit ribosomal protein L3
MGDERTTVLNLEVVEVDGERNIILLKGAVPGGKNGIVVVRKAVKS